MFTERFYESAAYSYPPDDEVLGYGGTIAVHNGDEFNLVILAQ